MPTINIYTTPADLYARLCILFSANVAATDVRKTLVKAALTRSAKTLHYFAPWPYRHRVQSVTTTANQAYTTLPSDYAREESAGDWLVETVNKVQRPVYVSPRLFDSQSALSAQLAATYPQSYTIDTQVITSTPTPIIRWFPTPTAAITFDGFQYYTALTGFDETGTSAIFPDLKLDPLWEDLAQAILGRQLSPAEDVKILTMAEVMEMMLDAKARFGFERIQPVWADKTRDADDQSVTFWSGGPRRDNSGGLFTG
jgi:hypothetical protein